MLAKRFRPEDLEVINKWGEHYCKAHFSLDAIPKNTFLVYDGEMPVVLGSVFITDSCFCYMDNVISNPECTAGQKQEALTVMFSALMNAAKIAGMKWWTACTNVKEMESFSSQLKVTRRGEGFYWFAGDV